MNRTIFITGPGTGLGKTVASAIVAESLEADYRKPVPLGIADGTDAFIDYEQEIAAWIGLPVLGRIPAAKLIDRTFVRDQAQRMRPNL